MKFLKLSLVSTLTVLAFQSAMAQSECGLTWSPKVEAGAKGFILEMPRAGGLPLGRSQAGMDLVCNSALQAVGEDLKVNTGVQYKGTAVTTAKAKFAAELSGSTFNKVPEVLAITKLHCTPVK